MFKAGQVVRLVPDQPGKGGAKTAQNTFSQITDTRVSKNMWVYQGRWQKTPGVGSYGPSVVGVSRSFSLHNYLKYDLDDASLGAASWILTHDLTTGNANKINAFNTAVSPLTYISPPVRTVAAPNTSTPAVYANIKNRCFISWSGTNSFIFDGTATLYNGEHSYDIGVEGPVTAPTYLLSGRLGVGGSPTPPPAVTVTNGSNCVNGYDVPPFTPIFQAGATALSIGGVVYTIQSPGGYVTTFTTGGTCTGIIGTATLTINAFLFPPNGDWNGLAIITLGDTYFIKSYVFTGPDTTVTLTSNLLASPSTDSYVVEGEQFVLTTAYQGGTVNVNAHGIIQFIGSFTWVGSGPQYAYAYYDPVTGHVSNISPVLQITESDQIGVNLLLQDIMPSALTDQDRFTKIIVFRTQLAGGGVMYPIGTFGYPPTFETINNVGTSPLGFADSHQDVDLLLNGGLSATPLYSNNSKPPAATHMLYYDQRVWLNPVNDPTGIVFSGDFYQVPFGVAEESFPPLNVLRVSSDDGRVRGMKLSGNLAEVTTDRYSYAIVGGPDSGSYRLVRLGPQTYGVGDYQMVELPGDIGDNASALAYLARDKRQYLMAPTYGNVCLSDPVSDVFASQITTAAQYYQSRVHYYPAPNIRTLITSLPQGVNMLYNFDQKTWCEADAAFGVDNAILPQGYATIYGGDDPLQLLIVNAGVVYEWMDTSITTGANTAYLETPPMDLSGGQKRRSQIDFVRIYTDAPSCTVTITVNETSEPYTFAAIPEPDAVNSLYANPSAPVDSPTAQELVAFNLSALTNSVATQTIGFRHAFRVTLPNTVARYDIFAVDVGFSILDEDADVEP